MAPKRPPTLRTQHLRSPLELYTTQPETPVQPIASTSAMEEVEVPEAAENPNASEGSDHDDDNPTKSAPKLTVDDTPMMLFESLSNFSTYLKSLDKNKDNSRTNVKEPEPFSGKDPKKLKSFLLQCRLCFRDRPTAFSKDSKKVNFALSYLKDTAQDWFEPGLSGLTEEIPVWLDDWDAFVEELETNFGPYDQSGDAENELMTLKMKDSQRVSDYLVKFNTLAARCGWDDSALRHHFYMGLPSRLKDDICKEGKPKTLQLMRMKAQESDARYWERRSEISREFPTERTKEKASSSKSSGNNSGNNSGNSGKFNPGKSLSDRKKDKKPKQSVSDKPDISHLLGSDGKLTPKEKQRRMDNDLCLFCGKGGHTVSECTNKASSSKARAATTSTTIMSKEKPATESKKE